MGSQALPPLYEMDDYKNCLQNKSNYFCNVQAELNLPIENQLINNIIWKGSEDPMTFDRTIIHRALCTPSDKMQNDSIMFAFSTSSINERLEIFNVTANVHESICTEIKPTISLYDQFCLITTFLYLSLVLYATYQERRKTNEVRKVHKQHVRKTFLTNLSLYHSWKKRTTAPGYEDYHKLLSIQGIRYFSMIILLIAHVLFMYTYSYIANPVEFERLMTTWLFSLLRLPGMFTVLPFFLFSSWLLTVQVHNLVEEYGELSLENIGILIINRYARLMVTFGVLLVMMRSSWVTRTAGPCNFSLAILNQHACNRNWFPSLLLISNYDHIFDICHPVTWYTSADFQLYILNLFVLYIKFKFRLRSIKFYSGILFLSCIIHGAVLYTYTDVMFKPTLRAMEQRHLRYSTLYVINYMSSSSIWSSSFIGVILGDVYCKTKDKFIKNTWPLTAIWASVFLLLPSLAVFISYSDLRGLKVIILACLMKPLYTLGIGLGVYGMSHNLGGIVKNLLESKYVVMLSNFNYCVYLTHSGVIMSINSHIFSPLQLTEEKLIMDCIITLILSFICGIFFTLTIEEPGAILQKKYLPQIGRWKRKTKI